MSGLLKSKNTLPPSGTGNRFFRWFPWVWLVAAYCITMLVLCLYGRAYIDSDMSSEMILANLLQQEGGMLTTSWWYSTELRVFCLQPFYRIGLLVFPHDWYAARMVGQGLCMLALIGSYLYAGHGLQLKNCGAWGAAALACPFGTWYLWYGPFGGYYLPHMIWILISFGAMLHWMRGVRGKRAVVHGLALLASSLISGLNGIKGIMGFYLPMIVVALVALGLQWHLEPSSFPRREGYLLGTSLAALAFAGGGYIVNSTVLAAEHSFANYNQSVWGTLDLQTLLVRWQEFLSLFGYPTDTFLQISVSLFSKQGILAAFSLLIIAAILFSLVRLLLRWKELHPIQRIAPFLLAAIFGIQGTIFVCAQGTQGLNASYWLTVMPFVFPVLQLEGQTEHFHLRFTRRVAAIACCVCFAATSIQTVQQFFTQGMRINPHLQQVCTWLENEGYTQGYSSFWNGNVLTEWSNGTIEMWVTKDFNTMTPHPWLQKTSHSAPPEGPLFLLTTKEELESMNLSQLYWWSDVVYEEGEEQPDASKRYIVMQYSSYEDMMSAIEGAQSWNETAEA